MTTALAPRAALDSDHGVGAIVALGLLLLLLHAAVAVIIGLDAYADGAWFDFAALVGEPVRLVWHNYPTRITAYLVRYAPVYWLIRAHLHPRLAVAAGHALWQLAPAVSAAACYRLLPAGRKAVALAPTAYFLVLGLLTWGFPTETWLAAAFAWPAAIALIHGRDTLGNALAGGLLMLAAVFSHETALLLIPLFLLAGLHRFHCGSPRNAAGAIGGAIACLALWALARRIFTPDPVIAATLSGNAAAFFGPAAFIDHPVMRKDLLIGLIAVIALGIGLAGRGPRRVALGLLLLLGLGVVFKDFGVAGAQRYQVRSVAALGLGFGIALVLADAALAGSLQRWLRRPAALPLVSGVALMVLAASWEDARFAAAWVHYDRAASAAINCPGAVPCRAPLIDLDPAITRTPAGWAWAAPFYSVMASRGLETSSIARDDVLAGQPIQAGTWARLQRSLCEMAHGCAGLPPIPVVQAGAPSYMPLSCADARKLHIAGRRPRALRTLSDLVCGAVR